MVSKFNVGLKTLKQGLPESEFYCDLEYQFRKELLDGMMFYQFRKIIVCYQRSGYNMDVMRQTACLVVKSITVNTIAAPFNCVSAGKASDLMKSPA